MRAGPLLIVGLGGVGMMGLQFASALTDKPILVADLDPTKREAALKLGAAEAFDPADPGRTQGHREGVGAASARPSISPAPTSRSTSRTRRSPRAAPPSSSA